jgi:hypothetical protein
MDLFNHHPDKFSFDALMNEVKQIHFPAIPNELLSPGVVRGHYILQYTTMIHINWC